MNLLYPKIPLRDYPRMLGIAVLGAIIAGGYGVIHDQITYSIGPEYFTQMKFDQFQSWNFGWPERVFVGQIGFLATWWVGLFAGWFLARIAIPAWPSHTATRRCLQGFAMLTGIAFISGGIGYYMGRAPLPDYIGWQDYAVIYGLKDLPSFVTVAYIHNASYLGALIGLIMATLYLLRERRKTRTSGITCLT